MGEVVIKDRRCMDPRPCTGNCSRCPYCHHCKCDTCTCRCTCLREGMHLELAHAAHMEDLRLAHAAHMQAIDDLVALTTGVGGIETAGLGQFIKNVRDTAHTLYEKGMQAASHAKDAATKALHVVQDQSGKALTAAAVVAAKVTAKAASKFKRVADASDNAADAATAETERTEGDRLIEAQVHASQKLPKRDSVPDSVADQQQKRYPGGLSHVFQLADSQTYLV